MLNRFNCFVALIFLATFPVGVAAAEEHQHKDSQGRDYWVYTPDEIDPGKTYTLVLGVHGYRGNGKGAGGLAGWVKQHDCIVFSPSYDSNGYQYLLAGSEQQTLDLIRELRKQYKLHDKIFVAGFSGGAQFAHRFAMKHPDLVSGCAAHSGGTWATGDYAERAVPNPKARGVLFVISCGEQDTEKSFDEAPFGRFEWAQRYEAMLDKGGFIYDAKWLPGVGHRRTREARQMTEDCYQASTQLLPLYEYEQAEIDRAMRGRDYQKSWSIIRERLADEAGDDPGIIGLVHRLHVEALAKDIERIDRWAAQQVRMTVRRSPDVVERRAQLESLAETYKGLPDTSAAIDRAIAEAE